MKTTLCAVLFLLFGTMSQAQKSNHAETTGEIKQNFDKSTIEKMAAPVNHIEVISTTNGIITYAITNNKIKYQLLFDASKRDKITALPGFFELGISSDDSPMRVKIDSDYADEYLNKYFKSTSANLNDN